MTLIRDARPLPEVYPFPANLGDTCLYEPPPDDLPGLDELRVCLLTLPDPPDVVRLREELEELADDVRLREEFPEPVYELEGLLVELFVLDVLLDVLLLLSELCDELDADEERLDVVETCAGLPTFPLPDLLTLPLLDELSSSSVFLAVEDLLVDPPRLRDEPTFPRAHVAPGAAMSSSTASPEDKISSIIALLVIVPSFQHVVPWPTPTLLDGCRCSFIQIQSPS